jgi:preprotein translocase subunit Sec61beta
LQAVGERQSSIGFSTVTAAGLLRFARNGGVQDEALLRDPFAVRAALFTPVRTHHDPERSRNILTFEAVAG